MDDNHELTPINTNKETRNMRNKTRFILAAILMLAFAGCSTVQAQQPPEPPTFYIVFTSTTTNSTDHLIRAQSSMVLKTNITETDFAPSDWRNSPDRLSFRDYIQVPHTEKWISTVVLEHRSLTFEWQGKPREIVDETPVSTNIVHLRLHQDWDVIK